MADLRWSTSNKFFVIRKLPILLLQGANLASGVGNAMVTIAIPWLILENFDSPALAGLVVAISSLPPLLISPFAGWLIDTLGRRWVSIVSDLLSTLSVIAFPLVAFSFGLTEWSILLLALFGALFDPAGYTARKTLLTDVSRASDVDQDQLNGIHDGVFGVGWILGPALGAWMIAGFGAINSFWVAAGLFTFSALCITLLRVGDLGQQSRDEEDAVDLSFTQGFKLLWRDRLLRTLTISILIIAAVYLPTESIVLPTYFEELDTPVTLGIVISLLAGGSTIGAFGYGWLSSRISRKNLIRIIMIGTAISILPMATLPSIGILSISAFALGFFWGPFNPMVTSLIQERIAHHEQGRVFGAQMSVFYAAPPLGMVLAGWSIESWGLHETYLALAITLSATALIALLTRSLREDL